MTVNRKKFKVALQLLVLAVVFGLGYLFGHHNLAVGRSLKLEIVNRDLGRPSDINFGNFWDVYNKIQEKSLVSLDPTKALTGAIKGLVSGLGDPFSVFLTADETKSFMADLAGQFDGIGAQLGMLGDKIVIVTPLDGSPAQKAGLKPKDEIVAIDNVLMAGMALEDAIGKIRGQSGTVVTLTIRHSGETKNQDIKITRAKITVKSVESKYEKLAGGQDVAVVKIGQFGDDTTGLFSAAAADIVKRHPAGIILDLRNNPGGYLTSAVDIASYFVDQGPAVLEVDGAGDKKKINPVHEATLKDYPLAVLINDGSASAAEILAGAVQDNQKGTLIGVTSFGKGTVQDLLDVGGGTLRITTDKWQTPLGHEINHVGIKPDQEVKEAPTVDKDSQLERAKQALSAKLK